MVSGLEPILHLAEAGSLDLGRASDLVTDSLSSLGLEADDLGDYLDKVAATASNSNTDIDALMEATVLAGGTFSRFNVPLEEANSFLGILANRGVKGSKAGTALNAIMTRLGQSTGPAADALEEMGISAYDSEGNFRGMETVMKDVQKEMEGMTDKEKAHYTEQLAGLNHGKSFEKMLQGLGDEYDELKGDVENSTGALKEMRDTMKDNLQGALENLSSAFEEIMISIGTALLPAIKMLVAGLQWLADKFNGLSDKTKTIIAVVAAATAGFLLLVGPLLMLIGFIPAIIAGFTALTTVLSAISAPVIAVIAGIAALVAALIYAWNTSEQFREVVTTAFNYVRDIVMQVINEVVAFVMDVWGGLVEFWQEHGEMILEATRNVWETIWSVLSVVMEGIWEVIKVAFDLIVDVVIIAWDLISGIIEGAIEIIMGIIQTFAALFTGNWSEMWDGIMRIIDGVWQIIVSILEAAIGLALTVLVKGLELIWTAIKTVFTSVWQFIKTTFGLIVDYIKFAWDNSVRIVSEAAIAIFSWVSRKFNEVRTAVSTVLSTVANTIRDKFQEGLTNVINKVTGIYNNVRDLFTDTKNKASDIWDEMWSNINSAVSGAWGKMSGYFANLWSDISGWFTDIAADAVKWGSNMVGGFIDGIKQKGKDVGAAAKGVVDKAADFIKFWSPAKKGPGRYITHWGRNMVSGLLDGVKQQEGAAATAMASVISGMQHEVKDVGTVDMDYATPSGIRSSLSSAVNGTVDVNSREDMIAGAIDGLRRDMANLRVEMEGETVGRLVTPHVNGKNALDSTVRRYF